VPAGPALVTGASRGLGRALALELARRGFAVHASMREPADGAALLAEARAAGLVLEPTRLDVTRPETIAIPPGLRVLVNNAGADADYLPLEHAPLAEWRRVFETNLFGLVEVTRRALPELRAAGDGVVVNVTSASLHFPMPFFAVYRASKAAVAALSESLAAELAPLGVRVLDVQPGPIATDMLADSDRLPEAAAHAAYRPLAEWVQRARRGMGSNVTSAPDAARAIADAIADPARAGRVTCDPVGAALVAGADAPHAERLRGALAALRAALAPKRSG
jgi:NAD(P)-dependent dehydrogenase (short-subunit alcohol dehydrogenase family)